MKRRFTIFESFGTVLDSIPDQRDRERLTFAVVDYGLNRTEPELEYPLDALFESFRDDIDNSADAQSKNRGGRPRKNPPQNEEKPLSETNENGGFEKTKTGVSENKKPGLLKNDNPNQTKPIQSNTNQSNPNQEDVSGTDDAEGTEDGDPIPYAEIIKYLNEKTGKHFNLKSNANRVRIRARWREGYRLDDFIKVVDTMCAKWMRPPKRGEKDMSSYCRPETLFGTKFDSYLNEEAPKEVTTVDFSRYDD